MSPEERDFVLITRLAALKQRLLELYDPVEVTAWFETPQNYLQGRRPIDLISDDAGYLEISRILDCILEGAFT